MNIEQKQNKNVFPTSIYTFSAEELNQIVDELQHIIDVAGLTKDASDSTQVLQSLRLIFSGFESLTGVYVPYGGNILPQGWLWCDGSALLRIDYPDLFAIIGTQFGEGDGSTTFNIPDFTGGRFIEGSDQNGIYKNAGLPNIKGSLGNQNVVMETLTGCFDKEGNVSEGNYATGALFLQKTIFDASKSNSIYSDNVDTVQPKSLSSKWIIKY